VHKYGERVDKTNKARGSIQKNMEKTVARESFKNATAKGVEKYAYLEIQDVIA